MRSLIRFALVAALATGLSADDAVKVDSGTLAGLRARSIGPAAMSGRISAIDGVAPADAPATLYVGAASGGVWKSTDGGTTFKAVFDEYNQSIGAIAVDPSDVKSVWVGTGESWMRNSVSVGDGVYRSTDGGSSWKKVGLENTEHIAAIAVAKSGEKASDTAYVCATGHAWNANEERGVFKTTDGGATWKKILYVDANTGCSDLTLDPQMPQVIYAGMWQFRRQPDFFNSGGAGSGLYKSIDGGEHWTKLANGIPAGPLGRIAVAVAPSRPSVVYALIESKKTALYRSDDLGEHWRRVNDSFNVTVRPFYFARLVVDPHDYNRVYKPGYNFTYSTDGGDSFAASSTGVHSDMHALWVNPRDSQEMFVGTDGGVYHSRDRAQHWRFVANIPVSQFYHVAYDMERPYNVYGGLQDNGSWMAPSTMRGGVANRHWRTLGGGDGFSVVPDTADSDFVYLESQGGAIVRVRRSTGETRQINPFPNEGEGKLRFNWNTPIYASPTQRGVIYLGAQYLFRSKDRGDSWERISPDLTTNDLSRQKQLQSGGLSVDVSSAENYTTIISISESPKNANVIWVGTDDGNLQVTRDGGKTWTNVAANAAGVPKGTWVSGVEASHFDDNVAYATFDGHRTGDMKTYVYKTADGGKAWQPLPANDVKGYAQVIREDLVNPRLLFLGTESGLFVSVDGGAGWAQFKESFPPVPVDDIAIHSREGDVILATHGRGIWIIDDISPLRALTPAALEQDVAMLPSRPSVLTITGYEQRFDGDTDYASGGQSESATITYYLKKRHLVGDSRVEVYDAAGKLVTTLPAGKRRGINRVEWPMRMPPPRLPAGNSVIFGGGASFGPRMPDGTYTVKLIKGDQTYTSTVALVPDPRASYTADDRAVQQKTVHHLYDMLEDFTFLTASVLSLRDQATAHKLTDVASKLDAMHKELVATSEGGWLSGEEQLRERLGQLYGAVNNYDGRPTEPQLAQMALLEKDLAKRQAAFEAIKSKIKDPSIKFLTREEWEKQSPVGGGAPMASNGADD